MAGSCALGLLLLHSMTPYDYNKLSNGNIRSTEYDSNQLNPENDGYDISDNRDNNSYTNNTKDISSTKGDVEMSSAAVTMLLMSRS
jgi:hypothetical protein